MIKKGITVYEGLVYFAYSFYIILGLAWFLMGLFHGDGHFNTIAFSIIVIFGAQFYFRHKLTNLIVGIFALFFSIFMLLDVISEFNLMAKGATYDGLTKALMGMSLFSIIMSGILIFSYTKLSFKSE